MAKLIKSHLARLIVLTAATYQVASAIQGFIWPKVFWDFLTNSLDGMVKPVPSLQIINLVSGLLVLAWEWPLGAVAGTIVHQNIKARLFALPFPAVAAALLYQATNPAIYYTIGVGVYFWAYIEGENVSGEPWALPPNIHRSKLATAVKRRK